MATYWLSFRIGDDDSYAKRYDDLVEAIRLITNQHWWLETTSFIVFESDHSIDDLVSTVKGLIDEEIDLVLIGMPNFKSARLIGSSSDDTIKKLMPFLKTA